MTLMERAQDHSGEWGCPGCNGSSQKYTKWRGDGREWMGSTEALTSQVHGEFLIITPF